MTRKSSDKTSPSRPSQHSENTNVNKFQVALESSQLFNSRNFTCSSSNTNSPQENKMSESGELLTELKDRVSRSIDGASAELHELSRDIWSCPELAYQESRAHERLVAFFTHEQGWTVDARFKLETAFRAVWRTGGVGECVNVGFLCEYDALPGIGHACGHNLIAEVGAAAGLGLKAALEGAQGRLPVQVQVRSL